MPKSPELLETLINFKHEKVSMRIKDGEYLMSQQNFPLDRGAPPVDVIPAPLPAEQYSDPHQLQTEMKMHHGLASGALKKAQLSPVMERNILRFQNYILEETQGE